LIIIENFTFTKNFKKMIFCAANARNLRSTIHFIRILIENKLNIQRLADNMAKVCTMQLRLIKGNIMNELIKTAKVLQGNLILRGYE
ncbi:hypothetical protein T09_1947, partial [Trichinella sp. T9]